VAVGIRREDKSIWERRVPITPEDARELQTEQGLQVLVQHSDTRVFTDRDYVQAGVSVQDDLSAAATVLAVKEIPLEAFESGKTYVFFAHVIKAQPYNMSMLKRMMELGCNLIDYERITDRKGRRLIFFGRHAGLAGMIDTLWTFGQRLAWEGIPNPFSKLRQTRHYQSLDEAVTAMADLAREIKLKGLPETVSPMIVGIAGYGNVSQGAQEILAYLQATKIPPDEISTVATTGKTSQHRVYQTVFQEKDMVEPVSQDRIFDLKDYYGHPENYRSRFETYLPHLAILVNAIYWDARYPRFVTKDYIRHAYRAASIPRLRVIGDISCDIEGAVEVTLKATEPGEPVFVYDPETGEARDGFEGRGPVIMAVDILPSELPREASIDFSQVLKTYVPAIAEADFSVSFDRLELPPEIKNAVILYRGELTPGYRYLEPFVIQSPDPETEERMR
jgi:alanine dehydrogenase